MSYDISLTDPVSGETLELDSPHQMKGGTYAEGGTTEAWLNVTWNYGGIFRSVMGAEGIRSIYGKTGAESIPLLTDAIDKLGGDTDPDYWKATEGNVKQALVQLRALAQLRPDGIWKGD